MSTKALMPSVGISTFAPIRPLPVVLLVTLPETTPREAVDAVSAAWRRRATAGVNDKATQSAAWKSPFGSEGTRGGLAGGWVMVLKKERGIAGLLRGGGKRGRVTIG